MKKVIFLTAILIALTGCGSKTASPNSSADKADKAVTSETMSENIKTTQSMDTKKAVTSGTTAKTTTKKLQRQNQLQQKPQRQQQLWKSFRSRRI